MDQGVWCLEDGLLPIIGRRLFKFTTKGCLGDTVRVAIRL